MGAFAARVRAAFAELPERLTREQARAHVHGVLATALKVEPDAVIVRWSARRLEVEIPTRYHYLDETDAIMEAIDEVVMRVDILDVQQLGPEEFAEELRRLRDGDA